MKSTITSLLFCLAFWTAEAQSTAKIINGRVLTLPDNAPAVGATVLVLNSGTGTVSDTDGRFSLRLPDGDHSLRVSLIGYRPYDITLPSVLEMEETLEDIFLEPLEIELHQVEVFSTGFQELPKERATGSFVKIDNIMVNRRISTNILERLEDITPGLAFNRDRSDLPNNISIRGTSTIFSDARPLIVIDNFPYDGPIENINPNDVESITVLRDAAAASIWGAKAGNGVIVITTKRGAKGRKPTVSLTANTMAYQKEDLFYDQNMGIPAFIEAETFLFNRGQFLARENSIANPMLSPVVETLIKKRDGLISEEEANSIISGYAGADFRNELARDFLRREIRQQYNAQVSGGGASHAYIFGAGYDRITSGIPDNIQDRITMNIQNNFGFLADRLSISTGIYLVKGKTDTRTQRPSTLYPYQRLRDEEGNHLPIVHGYSTRFVENALASGYLDWRFVPLDEIGMAGTSSDQQDVRINISLAYKISEAFKSELLYQYWTNLSQSSSSAGQDTYFSRDMINLFTLRDGNGNMQRNIPLGAIRDINSERGSAHYLRYQLSYQHEIGRFGHFNAIAGLEAKDLNTSGNGFRLYGYNPATGTSLPVNYATNYPRSDNGFLSTIPRMESVTGTTTRFLSMYANAAYTYQKKYTISTSIRKDGSNILGVNTNQKFVPLWSSGASWIISEEDFYNWRAVPFFRLKLTYGVNGNVNSSIAAMPTAFFRQGSRISNIGYLALNNPGNPDLRWEKINILNAGIDMESQNGRVSANLEFYWKKGTDLIGDSPLPASVGITTLRGNFADTRTRGFDLSLTTKNIESNFSWSSTWILSHLNEKVTSYKGRHGVASFLSYGASTFGVTPFPIVGNPLTTVYSVPYAGLDPDTGNPMGFLNGEPSTNYAAIFAALTPQDLIDSGSGRPTWFGAFRNDLSWKRFTLSANISFRFGYVFRRPTVNYQSLLNGQTTHRDYESRWREPGDELFTEIPSLPLTVNPARELFYRNSTGLVENAANIRWQDLRLAYRLGSGNNQNKRKIPGEVFLYGNNLGILWKATKTDFDPDFRTTRPLTSLSFGINLQL